jgi:hypothetical protein
LRHCAPSSVTIGFASSGRRESASIAKAILAMSRSRHFTASRLAAAPSFAMQREQLFAQRFQYVSVGLSRFGRLAFRQLRQLSFQW